MGKKGSRRKQEELDEIEEEIEEEIPEDFSDVSSRSSSSSSKSSSESSSDSEEESSKQESESESEEEVQESEEEEETDESDTSRSTDSDSKSVSAVSDTSYSTVTDAKSVPSPLRDSEKISVPASPLDDGFSEASFDSYHTVATPPKVQQREHEPNQPESNSVMGLLNPDLHIKNAIAYDRVIPQEDEEANSEKREQSIAKILGSSQSALNSQVGDRLQNTTEQVANGFKDAEYSVKGHPLEKNPKSMLSNMAKQHNALSEYFSKQKGTAKNIQKEVYHDNKQNLHNQTERVPFIAVDHSREIGTSLYQVGKLANLKGVFYDIGRQYYYQDVKELQLEKKETKPSLPPRTSTLQSYEDKKLSNEETGVLDILLKACLTKVNKQTKSQIRSQSSKKILPDDKLVAYEEYIKERVEKELETQTVDKFVDYLEPNVKPHNFLPLPILEQLLENVTSDVKKDSSLKSVSHTQIHKTLQNVLSEILVDPTISSVITNAVKVKLKQELV